MKNRFFGGLMLAFVTLCLISAPSWGSVHPLAQGGYSDDHGTLAPYTPPQEIDGSGKKLLMIYMVGSDLESGGYAGTNDFIELIKGYNAMSPSGAVDVIVAFGGANKDGWRGMKFANMAQIVQDGEDEEFGNEAAGNYLYQEDRAHMGDVSSLKLFLDYVREGYVNYEQRFLVYWDHGGSYAGFGNDENFNMDGLSLEEIDQGMTQSNIGNLDMVGFDSCLMGSIEVAKSIQSHADYLIGSEELEPGHGWNWEAVILEYARQSTIVDTAKAMIDNFVKNVHNYFSDGKTLSVVDLSKLDDLVSKTDAVANALASALAAQGTERQAVVQASTNVRDFGKQDKNDARVSIDLKHLALLALDKTGDDTLKAALNDLIAAIDSYVIHSKQDGTRPNSYGVSVTAPEQKVSISEQHGTAGLVAYQQNYQAVINGDTVAPQVQEQAPDTDADNLEFPAENETTQEYAGSDPYFQDWIYSLEDAVWEQYDNGEIDDAQLDQMLEEIATRTEADPEYKQWLQDQLAEGGDDDYFGYDDDYDEGDNEFFAFSYEPDMANQYPFLAGERAAFVHIEKPFSNKLAPMAVQLAGVEGLSASFADDNLTRVSTAFGNIMTFDVDEDGNEDDWFMTIATVQAYPTVNSGQYFTPNWNQNWYFIDFDDELEPAYMPMYFTRLIKIAGQVYTVYSCEIDYTDGDRDYSLGDFDLDFDGNPVEYASLEVIVSPENEIVDHTVKTYKIFYEGPDDEEGYIQFDKMTRKLKIGDKVRFYSWGINLTRIGYDFWFEESDSLTITKEPEYFVDFLEFEDEEGNLLQYYYSMLGEDVAGNIAMTDAVAAKSVPDDTAVSDWSLY